VDDPLLLHAAAGRARAAVMMMAAAVCAVGGHARGGLGMTRLSFIMSSSGVVACLVVDVHGLGLAESP